MNLKRSHVLFALALPLLAGPAVAAEWGSAPVEMTLANTAAPAKEKKNPWEGSISFGYLASSGNTDSETLNGELVAAYSVNGWVHNAFLSAVGSSDAGVTTNERYQAQYKLDKLFSTRGYVFGRLAFDKDRFSGIDHKASATFGVGRRLIDKQKHRLRGEVGAGTRREELLDRTTNHEGILLINLGYRYLMSENAEFSQTVLFEQGAENDYTESVTKVRANVVGALSVAVSYTVKHNTSPPDINEKTDTYTAISLEYKF